MHHDALEFPDGKILLLTQLKTGQKATVLQLPAAATIEPRAAEAETLSGGEEIGATVPSLGAV